MQREGSGCLDLKQQGARENCEHRERRLTKREHYAQEYFELTSTVDARCLNELVGDCKHVLPKKEDTGGSCGCRDDHSTQRVRESKLRCHLIGGNEDHLERNHDRSQGYDEEEVLSSKILFFYPIPHHKIHQ